MKLSNQIVRLTLLLTLMLTLSSPAFAFPSNGKAAAKTAAKTASGKIIETMNSGGYTYMLIQSADKKQWVAVRETAVKTGETVSYYMGNVMPNWKSSTLNRTFDSVIFSTGLAGNSSGAMAAASPQSGQKKSSSFNDAVQRERGKQMPSATPQVSPQQPSAGSMGSIVPAQKLLVDKAAGENSYTIEEIFAKAKELNGKTVRVQAKVVKFNANIMKTNWIHLQDGTGNPLQNSHDLVVTTSETAQEGQVVTFEGTIAADKDFGHGYRYDVLIEQAKTVK